MTSPNQVNDDRFEQLFELARSDPFTLPADLSPTERDELTHMRALLEAIDASWKVSEKAQQRVENIFLQQFAMRYPDHPWVRRSIVQTLGELLYLDQEEAPQLPPESLAQLKEDTTPLEALLDPAKRTIAVGHAIQHAALPSPLVGEFLLWLNRALVRLIPSSVPGKHNMLFARSQGKQRERTE